MRFTERHGALVEHCVSTLTGGGIFHYHLFSDELTEEIAEEVSLRVP